MRSLRLDATAGSGARGCAIRLKGSNKWYDGTAAHGIVLCDSTELPVEVGEMI